MTWFSFELLLMIPWRVAVRKRSDILKGAFRAHLVGSGSSGAALDVVNDSIVLVASMAMLPVYVLQHGPHSVHVRQLTLFRCAQKLDTMLAPEHGL